ncbi:hypothetical protein KBD59_04060 [Candidatus Gracilibacteria bacterium]|nr:hypothetical protein [Candidatus Gracilibacteria bacterium]
MSDNKVAPGWEYLPKDCMGADAVKHAESDRYILVANRPFDHIDTLINDRMLAVLAYQVRRAAGRVIQFLDIGGGPESAYARGVAGHPLFENKVRATNLDITAKDEPDRTPIEHLQRGFSPSQKIFGPLPADTPVWDGPADIVREDLFNIKPGDLPPADVIWSQQVADYYADTKADRTVEFIDRCAAQLAPGGVAYINLNGGVMARVGVMDMWTILPGMRTSSPLQKICDARGVSIEPHLAETQLDGRCFVMGGSVGKYAKLRNLNGSNPIRDEGNLIDSVVPTLTPFLKQRQNTWGKWHRENMIL